MLIIKNFLTKNVVHNSVYFDLMIVPQDADFGVKP